MVCVMASRRPAFDPASAVPLFEQATGSKIDIKFALTSVLAREIEEGAAFGAAILGGVAAGVWEDVESALAATVAPRGRVEPVPEWIEPYRAQRERFRALYPALRALQTS